MNRLSALAALLLLAACSMGMPRQEGRPSGPPARPTVSSSGAMQPNAMPVPEAGQPSIPAPKQGPVIGMLLPLTGPQAAVGKQLRDAALMALYDKYNSLSTLQRDVMPQLKIENTAGNPARTAEAARKLLAMGASVILGPLRAENVKAAAKEALPKQVPLVAFSNNPLVAGTDVYVFGFRSQEQAERLGRYALKQRISHYAAAAPQSEYGRQVVRELSAVLAAGNASLQPVEFFTEGQMPPEPAMQRLTATMRDWGAIRKALFLPLSGKELAGIAGRVLSDPKIDATYIKLLGTGLWDDPQVMQLPALQGAWFATTAPERARQFEEKFQGVYGYRPARLASLAYDAVALTSTLGMSGEAQPFSRQVLTDPNGFDGPANGIFRLLPGGLTERSLAIVEVNRGGARMIEAAPARF